MALLCGKNLTKSKEIVQKILITKGQNKLDCVIDGSTLRLMEN